MQHLQSYYCSTTAQKTKKEEECNAMFELKLLLNSFIHTTVFKQIKKWGSLIEVDAIAKTSSSTTPLINIKIIS